jgi:glycosyltransferase involved in cell wall biosynthesis
MPCQLSVRNSALFQIFVTEGVNGHLVPPEDPSAIAAALLDLLDNRNAASSTVKTAGNYTWNGITGTTQVN